MARRAFGSLETRRGRYRARYWGPDGQRYEAPRTCASRLDAEYWLAETERAVSRGEWKPPTATPKPAEGLDTLAGYARHAIAERDLTPRTREEYTKLLDHLILPTLGKYQLRHIDSARIRAWYLRVLSEDRPT